MSVVAPRTVDEVYAALDADPHAQLLAGGTDFMVEVNFGHRRPRSVVALRRVDALRQWHRDGGTVTLGAGLTYAALQRPELAALVPALASAARTVGSPQIRNAGTLGGNIATASPAGDTLPVLSALDAVVMVGSSAGRRDVSVHDLFVGPKRTTLARNELVLAVRVPVAAGPQHYLKIGTRNAMVIAVADVALVVDRPASRVGCAMGSVGPTVRRARGAEAFAVEHVDWTAGTVAGEVDEVVAEFGRLAAVDAAPIDDHRSTAAYRRRGVEVLAARALRRALVEVGAA